MNEHRMRCAAPICAENITEEEKQNLIWYAGESICRLEDAPGWRDKQRTINDLNRRKKFRHPELYWTVASLERLKSVKINSKGEDPDNGFIEPKDSLDAVLEIERGIPTPSTKIDTKITA